MQRAALLVVVGIGLLLQRSQGDEHSHTYVPGEEVKLWANKVGPYHNPQVRRSRRKLARDSLPTATEFARLTEFACCREQETYLYHSLPYCRPYIHERKSRSLGDALEGNTLINTGIKINFRSECLHIALCSETLFLASLARVYFLSGS